MTLNITVYLMDMRATVNELIKKARDLYDNEQCDELYELIEDQLKRKAIENDIDVWLTLAIVVVLVPIVDDEKSIECLKKALELDENGSTALLILAYVNKYERGGIDSEPLKKIENLHTNSDEVNSMLKYAASLFYDKNLSKKEELLKESIRFYCGHVWNYSDLAKLYFNQGRDDEARELVKRAIANIQKIYTDDNLLDYDIPDINDYLNERIKGIYLTDSQVEFIKEMLD